MSQLSLHSVLTIALLLILTPSAGAVDDPTEVLTKFNCERRMVGPGTRRLGVAHARVVRDQGRAHRLDENSRQRALLPRWTRQGKDDAEKARIRELRAEHAELLASFPRVRLTDDGRFATFTHPLSNGDKLGRMSPNGRWYVVRGATDSAPVRLLHAPTARIALARTLEVFGQPRRPPVDITFARDSSVAIVRVRDEVEIVDLIDDPPDARVRATYDLREVTHGYFANLGISFRMDARGDVFYDAKANHLVTFYQGPSPRLLKLWAPPLFRTGHFESAPEREFRAPTYTGAGAPVEVERALDRPMYSDVGYLSRSGETVVARFVSRGDYRTFLEFFGVVDRKLHRTVRIDGHVGSVDLSGDERFLAAQLTNEDVVLVYDLENSLEFPRWEIGLPAHSGEQLLFKPDGKLLVNSESRGTVLEFTLE